MTLIVPLLLSLLSPFPSSTPAIVPQYQHHSYEKAQPQPLAFTQAAPIVVAPTPAPVKKAVPPAQPVQMALSTSNPTLVPSSYGVVRGSSMTATAQNFAPGEQVQLMLGSATLLEDMADENGSVTFTFTAPGAGISFELSVQGLQSTSRSSRVIKLMRPAAPVAQH